MRILFFAAGTEILASSRTRVYQYLPYLEKEGIAYKVINFVTEGECKANMMKIKRTLLRRILDKTYSFLQVCKLLFCVSSYDIIFIQKVLLPNALQLILRFLSQDIIFDFDDAIFVKDIYKNDKFIRRFINMVSQSRYVVLENDFTKDFVARYNKNILMITGPIDINRYSLRRNINDNSRVTIGWIGSQDTLGYLEPLYVVFCMLTKKYKNLVIEIIGTTEVDIDGINLITKDWNLHTEVSDLHDFDIGIMPLFDDDWSRGKGGYKLLQYMSIGIPCVASPVGINQKIIRSGVDGYLATTPEEWKERLSELIEDPNLRLRMGRRGREIAEKEYSFEANLEKLISTFKQACQ